MRTCFQCWDRKKLSAQLSPGWGNGKLPLPSPASEGSNSLVSSTNLNNLVLVHTYQINGWLVWLVTSTPQLSWFQDNFTVSLHDLHTILSVARPVVTLLQGSIIDHTSAEEILHAYKLAIMKLRINSEGFGSYYRMHPSRLQTVTTEKQKEFLPKMTGEMSKDQL